MLPKTSAYVKSFDKQTKCMYFLIQGDNLLEKDNIIQDNVCADIRKEFHNEPAYSKHYLKNKIKLHDDEVTYFYEKKFLSQALIYLLTSNQLGFCPQEK